MSCQHDCAGRAFDSCYCHHPLIEAYNLAHEAERIWRGTATTKRKHDRLMTLLLALEGAGWLREPTS